MENVSHENVNLANGTHLQGYLPSISDADLTSVFGEPMRWRGDKVNVEWVLKFEDGTIATIYDWKRGAPPPPGLPIEWNVGGHDRRALRHVTEALARHVVGD